MLLYTGSYNKGLESVKSITRELGELAASNGNISGLECLSIADSTKSNNLPVNSVDSRLNDVINRFNNRSSITKSTMIVSGLTNQNNDD